eukprot:766330-Hanusia_phi.AAC.1
MPEHAQERALSSQRTATCTATGLAALQSTEAKAGMRYSWTTAIKCADQSGPPTTSQMYVDPFTQGNKKILNEPHFLQHGVRNVPCFFLLVLLSSHLSSLLSPLSPLLSSHGMMASTDRRRLQIVTSKQLKQPAKVQWWHIERAEWFKCKQSTDGVESEDSANVRWKVCLPSCCLSCPRSMTLVHLLDIDTVLFCSLLPRDEVKTGQTTGFVHGWYTITLDETSKTTNCRRSSFVIVGDEEDIALGFAEEKQEGKGSTKRGSGEDGKSGENDSVLSGQEENDRSCQHKSTRKRGRPSQKELAESKHRDGDEDGDEEEDGEEGDKRKKGRRMDDEVTNGRKKRGTQGEQGREGGQNDPQRPFSHAYNQDEEETKREEASEERKRKEDKDRREEEGKQEPQLTQEERDALEAARLAAQLNRNPRRRGAERDVEIHLPLPRVVDSLAR